MKFYLNNKSTVVSNEDFLLMIKGLNIFFQNFSEDWNLGSIEILNSTQPLDNNFPDTIVVFNSIDDDISSEYNFDTDQNSVARIFAKTILDSGGSLFYTDDYTITIPQQISSEIIGLISNYDMNKWYMDGNSELWWGDLCSPVYGNIFSFDLDDQTIIGFSDYVLPNYFGPSGKERPYNKMDTLMGPFSMDDCGYSIKFENGVFKSLFGSNCSDEKIQQVETYIGEFQTRFVSP